MYGTIHFKENVMSRISERENILRAIRFQTPDYIPVTYKINPSYYFANDVDAVLDFQARHPLLFPGFGRPDTHEFMENLKKSLHPVMRKGIPFTDDFGCTWETKMEGMTGLVTHHPLEDLEEFDSYRFPDPEVCMGIGPIDWEKVRSGTEQARARGELTIGKLRHGHTFLQMCDICGYENFLFAMMDEEPVLEELLAGLEEFNCAQIQKYLDMDVDMIKIPEDLGMQVGPMIPQEQFCRYIKPSYQRMMQMVRDAGKIVHMHSDGDIRTLAADIIDGGCQVLNLQDLVNGIDWIAEHLKGKVCVELDVDRQKITFGGTPQQIDDLIREEVEKLSSPEGGLMMIYGLYPGTSLENAEAVANALEKYCGLR